MVWDEIQDGKNKGNSTDSRISEVVELFAHKKERMPVMRAWEIIVEENATRSGTAPPSE